MMYSGSLNITPPEPPPFEAPTACPFCHATKIKAAKEKVDVSTYWRCEACGEIWNISRLQSPSTANRNNYNRYWK